MKPAADLSVYLITDARLCAPRDVVEVAVAAARGGARMIQLRDKGAPDEALIRRGRILKAALGRLGALLIVNDRVEVAAAIGADGVHVGQSDSEASVARNAMGPDAIIGLSIQNVAHAAALDPEIVDYVGVGPVFSTTTKQDHAPPLGFDGLARVCAASPVPAVAIGGLKTEHVAAVLGAGARGLAVVSAICAAPDPEIAARRFAEAIRANRKTAIQR
ncbi:MAG: thiamine phosphate synthase [Thiohalocapsa sp.]